MEKDLVDGFFSKSFLSLSLSFFLFSDPFSLELEFRIFFGKIEEIFKWLRYFLTFGEKRSGFVFFFFFDLCVVHFSILKLMRLNFERSVWGGFEFFFREKRSGFFFFYSFLSLSSFFLYYYYFFWSVWFCWFIG